MGARPLECLLSDDFEKSVEEQKTLAQEFLEWLEHRRYRLLLRYANASIFLHRREEKLRLSPKVIPVPVEYVLRELQKLIDVDATEEEIVEAIHRGVISGIVETYGRKLPLLLGKLPCKLVEFRRSYGKSKTDRT